ncbi:MAG: hypothetical protein C0608_11930 [Deltaproteobacteria bacterium]|nr:MAG: hypothetical protein C0608_11930 [Deltaproteobacteria bacterium]
MKRLFLIFLLLLPLTALAAEEPLPPLSDYLGSEGCKECHEKMYDGWKRTYHSTAVQDAKKNPDVILGDFTQKNIGFKKEDIEYTIGAHWNQRYMKKIGDDYYVLPKSWSISSRRWEAYNVWGWRKMPYSKYCIGCHVTRYDSKDGSFVEHTIGCESCHGPSRAHAESGGELPSINPNKLGAVDMEMICASCHVRGMDNSGEYHFPVGYVPGRKLSDYYTPQKMEEGESKEKAILREFRAWWGNAGENSTECEVCGIYNDREDEKPKSKNDYCLSCHKFGDDYYKHNNHLKETELECFDCHKKVSVDIEEDDSEDVHSISYFLVHKKTCYDKDYSKACLSCHDTWTEDIAKDHLSKWRGRETIHE